MTNHHDGMTARKPRSLRTVVHERLARDPDRPQRALRELLTNPDTGLHELAYFQLRLAEECARARESRAPLGLVLVRLFAVGAEPELVAARDRRAAQEAAAVLLDETRDVDLVTRLEADVFAVALLGASRDALKRFRTELERRFREGLPSFAAGALEVRTAFAFAADPGIRTADDLLTRARHVLHYNCEVLGRAPSRRARTAKLSADRCRDYVTRISRRGTGRLPKNVRLAGAGACSSA